ncbi:MAG TPA: hypothetical protein PLG34_13130, partial [Spirochaetota bacterium]|nr:hypothetical protein [Spirochaetota bacterium]
MATITYLVKLNGTSIDPKLISYFGPNLSDLDSEKTQRGAKGNLVRFRLGEIPDLQLNLVPTTQEQLQPILAIIRQVSFSVEWYDPYTGTYLTETYYAPKPVIKLLKMDPLMWDAVEIKLKGY